MDPDHAPPLQSELARLRRAAWPPPVVVELHREPEAIEAERVVSRLIEEQHRRRSSAAVVAVVLILVALGLAVGVVRSGGL